MDFVDTAEIIVKGGKGGDGAASFRREKFIDKGGPDGGDGGRGGNVYLVTDPRLLTLYDFKFQKEFRAEDGEPGRSQKQYGKDGADLVIKVPVGVIVSDLVTGASVDLDRPNMKLLVARGGKGGRGNAKMATPTRRAPRFAEMGWDGETRSIRLDLKVLAHVGLVGLPNAGKSSIIARISHARPEIAPYPFTTKTPVLGIVKRNELSLVVADIPGIVEGAHLGKGLGLSFLKHVERTKALAVVIDISGMDGVTPEEAYSTVIEEMTLFSPALSTKPRLIVLNKADLVTEEEAQDVKSRISQLYGEPKVLITSAATGYGIDSLVQELFELVKPAPHEFETVQETVLELPPVPDDITIRREGEYWVVDGRWARHIARYDVSHPWNLKYVRKQIERMKLEQLLRERGAKEGDTVYIHDKPFELL
ncbi:GTPase ObgE [Coprothermobacteraceae bacterium]|nr:GTPase ObgE [Coprothermobacteraceae bacterium]